MVRKKQTKKNKRRNGRGGRRGIINDVPQNNTNIRVRFRKVITFQYSAFEERLFLNPGITTLTKDLAVVYKLYRCTHFKLTFQASNATSGTAGAQPTYAINYIPALEQASTGPLTLDDYEGPAVGMWQNNRGTPYTWTIPSNVLNAMPYNWYETKSNSPDDSDLTQGTIVSTTDQEIDIQIALMDVTFEFQTLEDPNMILAKAQALVEENTDYVNVAVSHRSQGGKFRGLECVQRSINGNPQRGRPQRYNNHYLEEEPQSDTHSVTGAKVEQNAYRQ
jgi:hypothetical protein